MPRPHAAAPALAHGLCLSLLVSVFLMTRLPAGRGVDRTLVSVRTAGVADISREVMASFGSRVNETSGWADALMRKPVGSGLVTFVPSCQAAVQMWFHYQG